MTEPVREDLVNRIIEKIMEVASGEKEATFTLDKILDMVEGADAPWDAVLETLNTEYDGSEIDHTVIDLYDLIHDDHNAVNRLIFQFTKWEKEAGLR